MSRPLSYKTKQSEAILAYMASLGETHTTAAKIVSHFESIGMPIALTTVYRNLEKLADRGKIRRYAIDGISGACFQYVGKSAACREHFHLKCESCGELLHLRCDKLDKMKSHVSNEHDFEINTMKTVLYGMCRDCSNGG